MVGLPVVLVGLPGDGSDACAGGSADHDSLESSAE